MKLGIDRESIRTAILQHEQNASTRFERGELPYLKHLGLELQILHDGDLPNIVLGGPTVRP